MGSNKGSGVKPAESSRAQRDGKGFEICTAGLEFESGRALLLRVWDSQGFTRSPGPTKYAFREMEFPRIQKKIKPAAGLWNLGWKARLRNKGFTFLRFLT